MNDSEQKRIFLAIVLSGAVLVAWQAFFAPKPNLEVATKTTTTSEATVSTSQSQPLEKSTMAQPVKSVEQAQETNIPEEKIVVNNQENSVTLSSSLSISDTRTQSSIFPFNEIFNAENPHTFQVIDQYGNLIRPNFKLELKENNVFEGFDENLKLSVLGVLNENGKLDISLNSPRQYRYRFNFNASESDISNILKEYIVNTTDVERFNVGDEQDQGDGNAKWFGLDYHYHIFNYVLAEKEIVKYRVDNNRFFVETIKPSSTHKGYYIFTKKNYDLLTEMGDNLHLSVDFGFFGILAEPILRLLQFIYNYIPNYGWAIIILTLFVKLITFPLQIKSFKSMKKMQKLQPELAKIKEKFKDDLPRQQKETMELFKKAGANPLGGCFPLLLQMPVFFALYRVLYNAVELVNAPFYWWITDLSSKDPYYVLPVLMGVSMLGQMKLNPSTSTDPTQQKIMLFMPIIMIFFMKDLPSGLNLYIFISTIFGIAQQLAVYKFAKD